MTDDSIIHDEIGFYYVYREFSQTMDSALREQYLKDDDFVTNAIKYLESVNRWCDKELLFSLSHERIKKTFTVVDLFICVFILFTPFIHFRYLLICILISKTVTFSGFIFNR